MQWSTFENQKLKKCKYKSEQINKKKENVNDGN